MLYSFTLNIFKAVGVYIVEQPRMMERRMAEAQAEADKTIERLKLQVQDLNIKVGHREPRKETRGN